MRFYLDTGEVQEVQKAVDRSWIDGVTTNPSLIARSGRSTEAVVKDMLAIKPGWISVEVLSTDTKGMIAEGEKWAKLSEDIVIKIPMIEEGLPAVKHFSRNKIKTNVTLVFSPLQALMAARAGATLVSPFVGRLDDIAQDGMDLVSQIIQIYENYNMSTQVLVASVRQLQHITNAALMGASVVTVPYKVLEQTIKHPLTDQGLDKFLNDAKKIQG